MATPNLESAASLMPPEEFEYYTGAIYWNNFEIVQSHINQAISGDRLTNWVQHVRNRHGCIENSLFVNCGNGWVAMAGNAWNVRSFAEISASDASFGPSIQQPRTTWAKKNELRRASPTKKYSL